MWLPSYKNGDLCGEELRLGVCKGCLRKETAGAGAAACAGHCWMLIGRASYLSQVLSVSLPWIEKPSRD